MKNNIPEGAQLLYLPIRDMGVTAGYRNEKYAKQFGFGHYGLDAISESGDKTVYAMGNGEVIVAGLDGVNGDYSGMGWVTVIRYDNVYVPATGKVVNLIATTFHHEPGSIEVGKGDKVKAGTIIGQYSNTGGTTVLGKRMGNHLHMQFDTDVSYPLYCYGISGTTSKLLKRGTTDSTINPFDVLVADVSRKQYAYTRDEGWAEDWTKIPESVDFEKETQIDELRWQYTELMADYEALLYRYEKAQEKLEKVRAIIAE